MKNNILMDEVLLLKDNTCSIKVSGNSKIYIDNSIGNVDLSIEMSDNSSLKLYIFSDCTNNNINVCQNNNTNLEIRHSFDISDEYKLVLRTNVVGNNNKSNVYITGITRGKAVLDVDAIINEDTENNELGEYIKVLTRNGSVESLPKLHVNTKNVLANHGNSISNINKQELFYLKMKGIKESDAIKLIENGYRYGLFKSNEDFLKLIEY